MSSSPGVTPGRMDSHLSQVVYQRIRVLKLGQTRAMLAHPSVLTEDGTESQRSEVTSSQGHPLWGAWVASLPPASAWASASVFHDYTVTSVEMHTPLALKSLHLASEKDWRANPRLSAKLEDKTSLDCFSIGLQGSEGLETNILKFLPSLCIDDIIQEIFKQHRWN